MGCVGMRVQGSAGKPRPWCPSRPAPGSWRRKLSVIPYVARYLQDDGGNYLPCVPGRQKCCPGSSV